MFQQLMRGSRSKVGRVYLLDIVNLVLNEIAVQSNDYADANNNILRCYGILIFRACVIVQGLHESAP